jgi:hypothetical protein
MSERARAEEVPASLTVTRDNGSRDCPDSPALAFRAEQVAGKPLFERGGAHASDTWVQVEFVRNFDGFRAIISARGKRQGTRTLDDIGPECASLADAVAITLAILLDPAAAPRSEVVPVPSNDAAPPPANVIAGGPSAAVVAPVATPPLDSLPPQGHAAQRSESKPIVFGLEASVGAALAVLDGVAPFVEGGGRARAGAIFALGAGGGFVLPDRVEFGEGSVDLSLGYGYVRGCANVLPSSRVQLEACLEPMLGGLRGAGNDYDEIHTEWVFWSAAAALVQTYGPVTESIFWSVRARVLAPLARHSFAVVQGNQSEPAFELSPIAGTLSFGLDAEL